ncbi:MAG: hypothetical protein IPK61_05660 [Saprospiraceae bacterium]|jgi:transcriptional antiterminator|nr:hypothetical protein [Saprospiraceae bacterium]MBK9378691.1 hypothetical protein [Saprospiraceae bacterium]
MMKNRKEISDFTYFKTRMQLAMEMGISVRTLYRYIKDLDFTLERHLLSPISQEKIKEAIGVLKNQ